ncbi:occludin [Syngnathoides biaculeatus]|uniref:occludin n=1 Tax=Syngnathoides biaculeatus TaxID=300417 RepID=UPI002ADE35AB|nr:occludin [Syngnathoides biaculeatus]XP_061658204.1 occludin [Syngnathoides biaculeatus]XP_061658205.1 occludin [Syngnathoides biaculeatus]
MSGRPNGSPPPYESDGYNAPPQPAYSYYPDDEFQHFYRWTSPPGVLKIMAVLAVVMCVAIFACVASTLAWDSQGALSGFGGIGGVFPGGGGGGFGSFGGAAAFGPGNNYGYGNLGGNYNDPRSAKGFTIAMAALVFVFALAVFVVIVSHQSGSESGKFYLAVLVLCAVLALLMLIATIVYLVAVNPAAQSQGSAYAGQIAGLCAPYQQAQAPGLFVNQYLYHYCVVEPQEAIAVVFGFLVTAALVVMLVFALKTRKKIAKYGKSNILWKRVKVTEDGEPPHDVEAWVNNVSAPAEELPMADFPEKSRSRLDYEGGDYGGDRYGYASPPPEEERPAGNGVPYGAASDVPSSAGRRDGGRRDPDADYASSGDELDDDDADFYSEFPPVADERERNDYKREFERSHREYKELQAELDAVNKNLSDVDRLLDQLQEGSPQYLDALDEYNSIKKMKKSADYRAKKRRSKYLKAKLNHIKKMVSDYDRRA